MDRYKTVEEHLNALNIPFQLVEREAALTTEQADRFIEGIEGVRTKTMFLTNKKKTQFFLVIMDDRKRLDMKAFGNLTQTKGIQMASENSLYEKMLLPPGVVSPFGLLSNADHDIRVFIDREIISADRMSFHPNTNEKTVFLRTGDVIRFIESLDYTVNVVDL